MVATDTAIPNDDEPAQGGNSGDTGGGNQQGGGSQDTGGGGWRGKGKPSTRNRK